ncbi:uncharacterized protein si:ch211-243a20.3 isoform X1 [Thunnus albacares]|uniref:uncharacterized protein si:ch211-243a20.3 isoform X1 n=2 Tax=Thunnus albacares TaxID=8236 RepID=UPI001CF61F7B|nr:uncharacterized protein si:ch211-243a20.3 isoform X1 [Thunnus albacares]
MSPERGVSALLVMAPPALLMVLMVVSMATGARSVSSEEENELDYGYWNYREGADRVNVASVRSVTRVLDAWGKRIFNEIKTLLHSQPSTLLPDYSRVRPLSESVNDLFREVSLLHRRITELSHRLATLEPFLRLHGYREEGEEGARGGRALSLRGEVPSLARFRMRPGLRGSPPRGSRVLRRRRLRVLKDGGGKVVQTET